MTGPSRALAASVCGQEVTRVEVLQAKIQIHDRGRRGIRHSNPDRFGLPGARARPRDVHPSSGRPAMDQPRVCLGWAFGSNPRHEDIHARVVGA